MNGIEMLQPLAPIAVSMGDPAGIGPEIVVKAVAALAGNEHAGLDLVVHGDPACLGREAARLGLPMPPRVEPIADLVTNPPGALPIGMDSAGSGDVAFRCIVAATRTCLDGRARALVTAPISKAAMQAAGHQYPGHTELLAELAGDVPVRMMLANHELRTVLVSIHVSLRDALAAVTFGNVLDTIRITDTSLRRIGLPHAPRIAVAGLNPHAGEGGLFGREEIDVIAPAIAAARAQGIDVRGPIAPDTVFMRARGLAEFDVVVAMYHDQGLIPVKYLGLDQGVNTTLGLPFIRTSPDHGTAYDIAGRGIADPSSLIEAIRQADLFSRRPVR